MTANGWLHVSLLSLFLVSTHCMVLKNCTTSLEQEKCSLRYDMLISMKNEEFMKEGKNCSPSNPLKYCICNAALKIEYFEAPPYVFRVNGTVDGILPAMLRLLLKHCCGGCTQLIFAKKPQKSLQTAMGIASNTSFYDIMMPFITVSGARTSFDFPFQRLLDTPGVSYVELDETSERVLTKLANSVRDTWPLFIIMVILTIQGGVIVWLLDTNKNPDEFPPGFMKGTLEGSWWAFVSMTTVGYGDKSPKSYLGRLFGVLWISMGIAISGIFTATLSSAMTSAVIPEPTKLSGKMIGTPAAVSSRYEENIVYREGGTPKPYQNASDMIIDLQAEKIQGVVIDRFVLRHHLQFLKPIMTKFEIKKDLKNSNTVIGFIFSSEALAKWTPFLDEFFNQNKDAESRLVADAMKSMSHKMSDPLPDVIKSNSPFSSPKVYKKLIEILAISGVCILAFGFLLHMGKKLYFKKIRKNVLVNVVEMEKQRAWKNGEMERNMDLLQGRIEKTLLESLSVEMAQLREEIKMADK